MPDDFKLNEIPFSPDLGADLTIAYQESWFENPGFGTWLHGQTQIASLLATRLVHRPGGHEFCRRASQNLLVLLALNVALKEYVLSQN